MTTFPQLLSRIFNVLFFEPNNIFNNIVHLKSAQTCCFDDRVITCAASHSMARTAHVQHNIPQSMNHAEWTRTVQSCARNFSSRDRHRFRNVRTSPCCDEPLTVKKESALPRTNFIIRSRIESFNTFID